MFRTRRLSRTRRIRSLLPCELSWLCRTFPYAVKACFFDQDLTCGNSFDLRVGPRVPVILKDLIRRASVAFPTLRNSNLSYYYVWLPHGNPQIWIDMWITKRSQISILRDLRPEW